jgi:hypothetical protein
MNFVEGRINIRQLDSLSSVNLSIPDEEAKNALSYVKQFTQRANGEGRIYGMYISEEQLDQLVRIRDESDSRYFSRFVETIGCSGGITTSEVSRPFSEYESKTSSEELDKLDRAYYNVSSEAGNSVRTVQQLIRNNQSRDNVQLILPISHGEQITDNIDSFSEVQ